MSSCGRIKKVVADKGFGFVTLDEGGKDVFFHASALRGITFEELAEGMSCECEITTGEKGLKATDMVVRE